MTFQNVKNPFADPKAMTLQDVLHRLASADTLTPRQKGEICSAIHSAALWQRRTLGEIPASEEYINLAFRRINYGLLGISRARLRNAQSLVKKGLKAVGIQISGQSYLAPLNSTWTMLRDSIADHYARDCLGRFMRFCTAQEISPEQVNDNIVEAFRKALAKENMTARPDIAVQSMIRTWNRVVERVPGWPQTRLQPFLRREIYTLRWDQLRADFVADVERYLAILGGADPMHPLAPPRRLKPLSIKKRRYEMLQLISALHHRGEDIENLHSLSDMCEPDRVKKGLGFFIARYRQRHGEDADATASTMIGGIADAIRAAAKHHVQAPEDVVTELTRIARKFNRRSAGMSEKNRTRLAQLDSPLVERRLLLHPRIEMQNLACKSKPTRRNAVRYSVLLAIEILIFAPMRIENLAALDLEQHFGWPPRRKGDISIIIARGEVKNAQPLEYKIPSTSTACFHAYLDHFRPLLLTAASTALFPGRSDRPKRNDTLSKQIIKLIGDELGIAWNPHLFRHLAVRLYLRAHPGDYEGARRLLAHLSAETTFRIYESMDMRPAVDRYDALIESIRGPVASKSKLRRLRRSSVAVD